MIRTGAPKPPAFLLPAARREWKRVAAELEQLGLLTQVDMAALAGYCQSYARWAEAERALRVHGLVMETPSGYAQQRPEVSISQKERQLMRAFAAEFGLSPSSRGRLSVPGAKIEDEFEAVLSGGSAS